LVLIRVRRCANERFGKIERLEAATFSLVSLLVILAAFLTAAARFVAATVTLFGCAALTLFATDGLIAATICAGASFFYILTVASTLIRHLIGIP
jgi:hypothetical protein